MPAVDTVAVWTACLSIIVFLPGGLSRWVLPKLLLMGVAVLLALCAQRTGRLPRWVWGSAAATLVVLLVAALAGAIGLGGDAVTGLVGRWPRYSGPLVTLPAVVGAAWLGAVTLGPGARPAPRRALPAALSTAALLIALIAVAETAGLRPIASDLDRPGSLLGNATDQALVCALIATVLLARIRAARTDPVLRLLAPVGLAAAVLGVALSESRAGLLALAVGVVAVAVVDALTRGPGRLVTTVIAAVTLVAAVVAAAFVPGALARLSGGDAVAASSAADRWDIWSAALQVIGGAPVTGLGAGSFIDRVPAVLAASWYAAHPEAPTLESAHNWILEAAVDGGVLLIVVAVAAGVLFGRDVVRGLRTRPTPRVVGAASAVLAAATGLLVHPVGPAVALVAALLAGSAVAIDHAAVEASATRVRRVALRLAVGAWCLVLAAATVAEWPLQRGVDAASAGDAAAADAAFATASALRPWDADLTSIAAQTLAQEVAAGDAAALVPALTWTERAVARLPHSTATWEARAVALESAQEWTDAAAARGQVVALAPGDPGARLDYAIDLAMAGDLAAAREQALRVRDDAPGLGADELLERLCTVDAALCG